MRRIRACLVAACWLLTACIDWNSLYVPRANPAVDAGTNRAETPAPHGPKGSFALVFDDEFDGDALDATKWVPHLWYDAPDKGATKTPEAISVQGGFLTIRADRRTLGGNMYTTGLMTTHDAFSFTRGVFEVRAKMTGGEGLLSSAWMMPESGTSVPELDVAQVLGKYPTQDVMSYHFANASGQPDASIEWWIGPDFSADFHVFTVEWSAQAITWYVDGRARRDPFANESQIPSDPMFLILSEDVGASPSDWQSAPTASTTFPADFVVDYVRVWQ